MIRAPVERLAKAYHSRSMGFEGRFGDAVFRYLYYQMRPIVRNFCTTKGSRTDADINKILWVDPTKIQYDAKLGPSDRGGVYGGCWDWKMSNFKNNYQCRSLISHFNNGKAWKDTEYYHRQLRVIERNGEWRGCENEQDLLNFLRKYDDLYDNLSTDGYKSQRQLKLDSNVVTESDQKTPRYRNEIGVNIGRNGELLWRSNGRHRLCLAQMLKLDKVAVLVLTRHKQWQAKRNEIKMVSNANRLSDDVRSYIEHPDMADIM